MKAEKSKRFMSRKFVTSIAVMITAIVLRVLNMLSDQYFVICFLAPYVVYTIIEGSIDLKAVNIKTPYISIGEKHDGEDGKNN